MEYAGFGRRLGAAVLDGLIVGVAVNLLTLLAPDSDVALVLVNLGSVMYYVLFTGLRGQTPGKMALGIRVVGPDGGPPGAVRGFVREVIGKFFSALVLCVGYLWMLWDPKRQCWHDKLAGTVVVRAEAVPSGQDTSARSAVL
ncbi:MAG: RDD family protein [Bacillota bacterium]